MDPIRKYSADINANKEIQPNNNNRNVIDVNKYINDKKALTKSAQGQSPVVQNAKPELQEQNPVEIKPPPNIPQPNIEPPNIPQSNTVAPNIPNIPPPIPIPEKKIPEVSEQKIQENADKIATNIVPPIPIPEVPPITPKEEQLTINDGQIQFMATYLQDVLQKKMDEILKNVDEKLDQQLNQIDDKFNNKMSEINKQIEQIQAQPIEQIQGKTNEQIQAQPIEQQIDEDAKQSQIERMSDVIMPSIENIEDEGPIENKNEKMEKEALSSPIELKATDENTLQIETQIQQMMDKANDIAERISKLMEKPINISVSPLKESINPKYSLNLDKQPNPIVQQEIENNEVNALNEPIQAQIEQQIENNEVNELNAPIEAKIEQPINPEIPKIPPAEPIQPEIEQIEAPIEPEMKEPTAEIVPNIPPAQPIQQPIEPEFKEPIVPNIPPAQPVISAQIQPPKEQQEQPIELRQPNKPIKSAAKGLSISPKISQQEIARGLHEAFKKKKSPSINEILNM